MNLGVQNILLPSSQGTTLMVTIVIERQFPVLKFFASCKKCLCFRTLCCTFSSALSLPSYLSWWSRWISRTFYGLPASFTSLHVPTVSPTSPRSGGRSRWPTCTGYQGTQGTENQPQFNVIVLLTLINQYI